MIERVDKILEYWFEGKSDQDTAKSSENPYRKWFSGGKEVDEEIRSLFEEDVENALNGDYDNWASAPRSCLALVIILDQFTRNIYRDTPQAFSGDQKACQISLEAIYKDLHLHLIFLERVFLYMPFMHAEKESIQKKSVELFDELAMQAKVVCPHNVFLFENNFKYASAHRDDIVKYGRFPYRNSVLGRENTELEEEFLSAKNKR